MTILFNFKPRHDYYFQVQTQMYCTGRHWCGFVLRTDSKLHIERVLIDKEWQCSNIPKLKQFYFTALFPKLASPRHHKGGNMGAFINNLTLSNNIYSYFITIYSTQLPLQITLYSQLS